MTVESFNVIRASAFRALKPWIFDKIIPLELINAVKLKYQFVKPDIGLVTPPVDFQAGKFSHNGKVVSVEQLVIAYIGNRATSLGASTRESTDASEAFLEQLIEWAAKEYKLDAEELYPKAYFSQVEFVLSKPLSHHFAELLQIGAAITTFVKGYGLENCPLFEFGGFSMNIDAVKFEDLKPMPQPFAIERRAGSTYDENKYFSQAPLRTQDHRAILEQIERLLLR
jgi:hypothetical protein